MKILGIVGSPRRRGNTYQMIKWIIDYINEKDVNTEIIALTDFDIRYCLGCSDCMIKGRCPQKDDVERIHKRMIESNGIIFGAPSYVIDVPAQTKVFFDRSAFICHRPQLIGKLCIAVSPSAGSGENRVADYINGVLATMGVTPIGELATIAYGNHIFPEEEKVKTKAKELAEELVNSIREELRTHKISKSYKPRPEIKQIMRVAGRYLKADYEFWKEKGWLKEIEAKEKEEAPAIPESCEELIKSMPQAFNPEVARDMDAAIQFIVTGKENFKSYLRIKDQRCTHHEGEAQIPTLIITTPADIWLKIVKGEISGTRAYFTRRYKVKGDWKTLTRFDKLFGK